MRLPIALAAIALLVPHASAQDYVKKATRAETVRALLAAKNLPDLGGAWLACGPFDFSGPAAFETKLPPETGAIDLKATYAGKNGVTIGWKPATGFAPGKVFDLMPLAPANAHANAAVFLLHDFDSPKAFILPLSLGSDDTLTVDFNGERLLEENTTRPAVPDSSRVELKVKAGKNRLLIRVGQYAFDWKVYVAPDLPAGFAPQVVKRLDRDFPTQRRAVNNADAEAKSYALSTFTPPAGCVLEVGGITFTPSGDLLACTRRGEIWRVTNPSDPAKAAFKLWASGLHEALGIKALDDRTAVVCQRPELTRVTDADGDGAADTFTTICDRWGVSGDYHEYAFGPAFDKKGDAFVTLNVGFGGGHQSKAAWRGWCVKVAPDGTLTPFAYGLRSPNSVAFSPDGDLFYADNQGEWVATNKLCHLEKGKFYGHQASLKWLAESPFAGVSDKIPTGRQYDGTDPNAPKAAKVFPAVTPPAVWFPYGRMGQSLSEPVWDTTGGKFGPFAGQCFAGDQTRSTVMRVSLEKVNGTWQGACFPFREGLQCGVNRLCFGPDGALYAGETNRGWGSTGGKPFGLQRIAFTGEVPAEIHAVKVTPTGFDLTFTKPVDPKTLSGPDAVTLKSFTYVYLSQYGAPETDQKAEPLTAKTLSADGKTLSLTAPGRAKGRVYEFKLTAVTTATGEPIVHPEAYYTLNEIPR
jgi:hypothetical protein